MLRIANPGSDIRTFVRVFRELFDALHELQSFTLDDMSETLVKRNLMTSSGFMGEEALERGYRDDRSRDAPYNQSKMYSELLRVIGWIHPAGKKLEFKFTFLGQHVATAHPDAVTLIDQCLLGIAYPNPLVEVKAATIQRPFVAILAAAADLDGLVTRDEMIVGPLSLANDRDGKEWQSMLATIRGLRGSRTRMDAALSRISKQRKIALNTMRNYTRFPVAALPDIGWAERIRIDDIYGNGVPFLRLTEYGLRTVAHVRSMTDIRAASVRAVKEDVRVATIRLGFYQLLDRAGFDCDPVREQIDADAAVLTKAGVLKKKELLFSPFQELALNEIVPVLPDVAGAVKTREALEKKERVVSGAIQTLVPLKKVSGDVSRDQHIATEIRAFAKDGKNEAQIVETLLAKFVSANKDDFYPLVASLFCVLGFDCENPRPGRNYERYDAIIKDPHASIPVEIKSPGEELFLSVKAVRQALENKIILLSRMPFPTRRDTTSLVVGYNLPNDRAEVASLVADVFKAFGLRIGIVDFRTLLRMACASVLRGLVPDRAVFEKLLGVLDVRDAA